MPDTATAEAPVTEAPAQTAPVNPELAKLFGQTWGTAESRKAAEAETSNAELPTSNVEPGTPAAVEKPAVIQHAEPAVPELPPVEIFQGKEAPKLSPDFEVSDDEIPLPVEPPASIKTEKGKADWKAWREGWKGTLSKIKQLEAGQQNGAHDAQANARIAELEGRLVELSTVAERANLELHPAFQAQFVNPIRQMAEQAKEIAAMADVGGEAIEKVLGLAGKARVQAMDELMDGVNSPTIRAQLGELLFNIERKEKERAQVLNDVKGNSERLAEHERAEQHRRLQAQQKQIGEVVDSTFEILRDQHGFELLREVPGNEKWNTSRKAKLEQARHIMTGASASEAAAAAVLSVLAPEYRTWALAERDRANALEKENAELRGADPKLGGRTATEAAGEAPSGAAAVLASSWAAKK